MSDPRVARGQPEMWPGGVVSPRSEIRTPMQLVHVELSCLNRRRGRLVWTGAPPQPEGSLHACSDKSCGTQILVPGDPYPRKEERIDPNASIIRG